MADELPPPPSPPPHASWDDYFMSIAQVVATRSTCPRKYVGAVIVRNRTILSAGYNGSIRGIRRDRLSGPEPDPVGAM